MADNDKQGFGAQLGMQAAGGAVGSILGLVTAGINDRRQLKQQRKLSEMQLGIDKQMTDYQQQKQLEMWEKTGYGAQKEQMKAAGINPALMYGMGGGGAQTIGGGAASSHGANAPSGGGEATAAMAMGIQSAMMAAQVENIKADTKLKETEAQFKAGAQTENVKADTGLKVLSQVIADYTGKEAKSTFERVKEPNRGVEAKTYEDELNARQGVAGTIYELWLEGKLKDKAAGEIESILINNAKNKAEEKRIYKTMDLIDENIKGAKLDNILKELETKLQTETGIDRNSPAWMKILGRLFVQLTERY